MECRAGIPGLCQLSVEGAKEVACRNIRHRPKGAEQCGPPGLEDRPGKAGEIISSSRSREPGLTTGESHQGTVAQIPIPQFTGMKTTVFAIAGSEEQTRGFGAMSFELTVTAEVNQVCRGSGEVKLRLRGGSPDQAKVTVRATHPRGGLGSGRREPRAFGPPSFRAAEFGIDQSDQRTDDSTEVGCEGHRVKIGGGPESPSLSDRYSSDLETGEGNRP